MNKENNGKHLSMLQKLGYGLGDAGSNFSWTLIASFLLIYCTNTLGINAAVVGTLLMISKVLDGISDVIMGSIIDKTHHRMGKARFWYFISAFPTAIFTFLLFNVPGSFTSTTKYAYVFIVYTLIGAVFYTMNNIAYSSLIALCTKDPKDRVQMGSFRAVFAIVAVLIMSYTTNSIVEAFGGGQHGWTMAALIFSALSLVLLLIPVAAVRELPESELEEKKEESAKAELSVGASFKLLLRNKYFLMILVLYLVYYLASGITSGMGVYFATYQLGNAAVLGTLSMASMLPILIVMPILAGFTAKWGMRTVCMAGHALGIVGSALIILGGMNGSFPLVLVGFVVRAFGVAPQSGAMSAIIAEADEYSFLKYGHRITGTMYSCSSVGIKVGTGLGTALTGLLLTWGGFDGLAATQTASALATINWSYLLAQALLPIISFIIFYFLKVEKDNKKMRASR